MQINDFKRYCLKSKEINENQWKPVTSNEAHWKSMNENQWQSIKINENAMKMHWKCIENQWKSMKINEHPWRSMKTNENQCKSMKQWKSMKINKINENRWKSMNNKNQRTEGPEDQRPAKPTPAPNLGKKRPWTHASEHAKKSTLSFFPLIVLQGF